MKRFFINILLIGFVLSFSTSCSDDDFTKSIYVDPDPLDPTSITYEFDLWLNDNYRTPYNLDFCYKLKDIESDFDYNLTPTSLKQSKRMAYLIKYLWFDVYNKVVSENFLKEHGPRFIHLIGSPAYNPSHGTVLLGTAEGGIKISLYQCNDLDIENIDFMNEYYFQTMHHEFAHILHQKKTYPKEYDSFSKGYYNPTAWQDRTMSEAASLGFVSPYGSSQPREDFVEVIATYIVKSDEQWNYILDLASKPGINMNGVTIDDPLDGQAIIQSKLNIAKQWLSDSWGVDLEALRAEVQERQKHIGELITENGL
ncbi:putative zinc-binding metallopeptidase [Dysgonomonas sp. 520]|uniref:zinc-binding metallopeptidase n=1 Tax=Dysgonomonas sp. 520 TaxID=2302931 RepID=UPI0013D1ABAB|nr:putative zinc-binding metallopeptidase [Dysgonomonas sp. 520]NDW10164.1 hypothetical protein [Dysgonomonas sp. 520]